MRKREREPQQIPKPFNEMSPQEQADWVLKDMPPGAVYAYTGDASPEDARKLRWQLTPDEKKIVDRVTDHQVNELRNMTPEQVAKRSRRIRKLLGIEAVTSTDIKFMESE